MKKYQKIIALASIIVIAITITVLAVYFNSIEKDKEFQLGSYTVVSQGAGVAIVGYTGDETTLVVPAKIENKKVVAVKLEAFNSSKVVNLSFEKGANIEIEEGAFNGNTVLQTITLPSTMTSIPKICFMNCTSLNEVNMPDSITYIGEKAFYGCITLTKNYEAGDGGYRWLNLPKSLKEICADAFNKCDNLDAIRVSEKLELIDDNAFRATQLQTIGTYEEDGVLAVKEIGKYAFYGTWINSSSTKPLTFPALTTIGDYAFASTSMYFKEYTIPSSVTSVGNYAFSGSSSLTKLTFESNEEGDKDLTLGKYFASSCIELVDVKFNRSVTEIPEGSFMGCIKLLYSNDLILPEEVTTIGPGAFGLFVSSSSNTKYCEKTIKFKHTDVHGEQTTTNYNGSFKVSQLQRFANELTSGKKHFVITDYDITTLYAYVGLYATDCTWTYESKEAVSFKFLFASAYDTTTAQPDSFDAITTIKNGAFAGAQFEALCLPGATTNFEKNAFYKSNIKAIYIDEDCVNKTSTIDEEAFDNMNNDISNITVFIKGERTEAGDRAYANSRIKAQLDAVAQAKTTDKQNPIKLCEYSTRDWPK